MNQTPLKGSFAYLLDPDTVTYLKDEVSPAVWEQTQEVFEALATIPYKGHRGIGSFYVVFLDPNRRDVFELMHADKLYDRFLTKFYNEEILLIIREK